MIAPGQIALETSVDGMRSSTDSSLYCVNMQACKPPLVSSVARAAITRSISTMKGRIMNMDTESEERKEVVAHV